MAREEYRVVVPTFWTDPEVKKKLTRDQKHLALYYFTSPHSKGSMTGVYYCPIEYVSVEADLPVEEIRRALIGPLKPFVTYDEETEEVFVHAFAKHNVGDELKVGPKGEDNRIEAVRRQVTAIHSTRLARGFLARYNEAFKLGMSLPEMREAPSEPLASPSEAISSHVIPSHPIKTTAQAADAVPINKPHNLSSVLGLVVEKLYFGNRPLGGGMTTEASIAKSLAKTYGYDRLAAAIEGLAKRRDNGELPNVARRGVVGLRYLNSDKFDLNQVAVSEDAAYRSEPSSRTGRSGTVGIADILGRTA